MKKYQKVLLITAGILVVGGGILGTAGLAMGGVPGFWITDKGIQTAENIRGSFVEKKVPLSDVTSLDINCVEGDVEFVLGDDFHLEYGYDDAAFQIKNEKKGGTYYFTSEYARRAGWHGMGVFWGSSVNSKECYVKIYIPKGTKFKDLNLVNEYGKIKMDIGGTECENAVMKMESGELWVNGLKSAKTDVCAEYGNVEMENCDAGTMEIKGESGNITMCGIKTGQMKIETESGDVEGKRVELDRADIEVAYGECEIDEFAAKDVKVLMESGNVKLGMTGKEEEYQMNLENEFGEIYINGKEKGNNILLEREKVKGKLEVKSESGSIWIETK